MRNPDHQNNFNLLRFFFASLVIVSHVPELQDGNRNHEILSVLFGTISFGEMAVDSFFVLSGFLIVKSWQDRPHIVDFLSSRILRIYPGFIAASILCAIVVGPNYGGVTYFQYFDPIRFVRGLATLSMNGIPAVFPKTPYAVLNGAMWSIPYEFMCYLLVLISGLTGVLNRRWVWLSLFLLCTIIHVANRLGMVIPFDLYFRCGMTFTAGGCFYLYRNRLLWKRETAWLGLLLFAGFLFVKPLAEPALCILWGYAVLYYAMAGSSLLGFNRYPDVSYGVYLYAWPIIKVLLWHFPTMNVYAAMLSVFVLSVCAGTASSFVVERPFMHLKKALVRQRALSLTLDDNRIEVARR
jgi:peptidoglycan/LPS O-acetylase OafA/YrhL